MKILLLTDYHHNNNETFLTAGWSQSLLCILQKSKQIEVGFVCLTSDKSSKKTEKNTTTFKINSQKSKNPFYKIYNNIRCSINNRKWLLSYLDVINEFNPDIVHIFGTENFMGHIIPLIKCKVVVHIQGILNSYLNTWFPSIQLSELDLILHSTNLLKLFKGQTFIQQYKTFQKRAQREKGYLERMQYCMGRTDWDKSTIKIMNDKIIYFHVEEVLRPQFYESKNWTFKNNDKFTIVSVLSPSLYKGFDLILKSAQILCDANFNFNWIVCGTDENDQLVNLFDRKIKKDHNTLNVYYVGSKNVSELINILLSATIFVHPSYIENSPNSLCEAQLIGIPIIATYAGGIPSLIENNKTGILVPVNDPYYLASKIIELTSNKDLMNSISREGRQTALARHDRANILFQIEDAYNYILQS